MNQLGAVAEIQLEVHPLEVQPLRVQRVESAAACHRQLEADTDQACLASTRLRNRDPRAGECPGVAREVRTAAGAQSGVPKSGEKLSRKASDYFSEPHPGDNLKRKASDYFSYSKSPKRGKQTPAAQALRTAPELLLSIQQNDYDTATLTALVDFASALESSAANKLKVKKEKRSNSSDKRLSEAAVDSQGLCAPAPPEDD